jgi:Cu(I)/Ag(I) efflux system protein CusF
MQKFRFHPSKIAVAFATMIIVGGGATNARASDRAQGFAVAQAAEKATGEAEGVIKGVDASERKVLITHGPISGSLQMPSMTMSFRVASGVDLSGLAPGAKVKFTVSRDEKNLYVIDQIRRKD